jgi:hypothetical protein
MGGGGGGGGGVSACVESEKMFVFLIIPSSVTHYSWGLFEMEDSQPVTSLKKG